jgi:hypothetical protein
MPWFASACAHDRAPRDRSTIVTFAPTPPMSPASSAPDLARGAAPDAEEGAWSPLHVAALGFLILLLLGSLVWLVHPWYDATNDGSMYIGCARSILAGKGYAFLGEPFRIRPPGLSYLIAPVIAVVGTDFYALNLTVSLFGACGIVLLFVFQRGRLGWLPALAVAVAIWLNPGYQRSCNQVMSEMPGVALLLLSLCVERWATRARTPRSRLVREILLGVCIAAAAYVRTVNVLLAPAIFASRLVHRPKRGEAGGGLAATFLNLIPAGAVAVLLLVPWSVRNGQAEPPPPADQTYLYSYGTGMWHTDPGDPRSPRLSIGEVLERIPAQAGKTAEVLGSRMQAVLPLRNGQLTHGVEWTIERDKSWPVIGVALMLIVGSLVALVKRRAPADFFTWLALGVIAIYFGFDDRLLMPVYVLAFPATVEIVQDVLRRLVGARGATALITAGVLGLCVLDFEPRADWPRIQRQHEAFASVAEAAEGALSPTARVAAPVGWHYGVYLDRDVYSLQWNVIRATRQQRSAPDAMEKTIDARAIDTVLFSPLVPTDTSYVPYFRQKGYEELVRDPAASVFRVR